MAETTISSPFPEVGVALISSQTTETGDTNGRQTLAIALTGRNDETIREAQQLCLVCPVFAIGRTYIERGCTGIREVGTAIAHEVTREDVSLALCGASRQVVLDKYYKL